MSGSELSASPQPDRHCDPCYVEALVDCPGSPQVLTYRIPTGHTIAVGDILTVPLGRQQVGAIALRLTPDLPRDLDPGQVRAIEAVASSSLFPPGYWTLLQTVADYYHSSLMATIRVVLPPGLLRRSQKRVKLLPPQNLGPEAPLSPLAQQILQVLKSSKTGDYSWTHIQKKIKGAAPGLRELQRHQRVAVYLQTQSPTQPKTRRVATLIHEQPLASSLTPRQQEVLQFLKQRGGELWAVDLMGSTHASPGLIQTLARKGAIALSDRETLRLESSLMAADHPQSLTLHQRKALEAIQSVQGFGTVLLHGVTGSGKTEVYLQAIAPILAAGQSALLLVPEIGLTPQISDRVRARFGQRVRVYHSALSEGERYDTWRVLLQSDPQVVVGTRSAIFAPLGNLGLIILDEEHDGGYKQESPAPCYHARTVAHWRAQLANCPLILGSATPSLESWHRVQAAAPWPEAAQPQPVVPQPSPAAPAGSALYVRLPERVHAQPLPPIVLVDMRQELQRGNRTLLSQRIQQGLAKLQAEQQQGLLFINRRGHSTFVSCRSCGYVVECPNCSVSLTYHHTHHPSTPLLRCHYCNHTAPQPPKCPSCGSPYFRYFGSGTQRVMEELREQFPTLRVLRFDSDTTRRKGAHRELLTRFSQGEVDLMVGTQMVTKGLDIPQVQFVGVLAADSLLNLSDFRASERTMQTLLQVAGRTGRGTQPGQVVIQTYNPEHPVLQAVKDYQFQAFTQSELAMRQALQYPPYGQLLLLKLSSPNPVLVEQTAQEMASLLREMLGALWENFALLGPAPAQVLKVARRFRWQILLKLPENLEATPLSTPLPLDYLRSRCPREVRLGIDVDPLHFG